jgi:hypothetical protein
VFSGVLVVTIAGEHFYPFLLSRLRAHRAPGIPCALFRESGTKLAKPRAKTRGEIADSYLTVIASEAKQSSFSFLLRYGLLRCARNDGVAV